MGLIIGLVIGIVVLVVAIVVVIYVVYKKRKLSQINSTADGNLAI